MVDSTKVSDKTNTNQLSMFQCMLLMSRTTEMKKKQDGTAGVIEFLFSCDHITCDFHLISNFATIVV